MGGSMDKIRSGKWGRWIGLLGVLFRLFAVITAQPGFLSINCGAKTNHTDAENNIKWVTDDDYIDVDVGESADIGDASYMGSYLHSLRLFPKPLNKSCYQLPVASDVPYLIRLWFALGNFKGYRHLPSFAFSIETTDLLAVQNVPTNRGFPSFYENMLTTSDKTLHICLVRTSQTHDPFISAIELRKLQDGMYQFGSWGRGVMLTSTVRYPQDQFDRIWTSSPSYHLNILRNVTSKEPISTVDFRNLPPPTVMQTAWVVNSLDSFPILSGHKYVIWYFAEIETLNMSKSRSLMHLSISKHDAK